MVLEKPKEKKLAKIESLKVDSDHLLKPLLTVRFSVTCISKSMLKSNIQ
jgi:hypothetical protein